MKQKVLVIALVLIFIGSMSSQTVVAQSQNNHHPLRFINLSFYLQIHVDSFEDLITPGETREVNLTLTCGLNTGGLFALLLYHLLEGRSFPYQLSIEYKPDWCEAWTTPENFTGVVSNNERYENSTLFIHVYDDAPGNYTLGWVKLRATVESLKGPFKILTLIQGYESDYNINFATSP